MAKLKRINLGKKETSTVCEAPKGKNKVYYPTIYISNKKLPIEPEEVGKTYNASVKLKLVGVRLDRSESNGEKNSYDFEVREIVFGNKGTM